jgi:hypothetical protein
MPLYSIYIIFWQFWIQSNNIQVKSGQAKLYLLKLDPRWNFLDEVNLVIKSKCDQALLMEGLQPQKFSWAKFFILKSIILSLCGNSSKDIFLQDGNKVWLLVKVMEFFFEFIFRDSSTCPYALCSFFITSLCEHIIKVNN